MRTLPSLRAILPTTSASTFSSPATSRSGARELLYFITEGLEMTRKLPILPRSVMSTSVMPSAKKSCVASPDKLSSGSTAIDWIFREGRVGRKRHNKAAARTNGDRRPPL